MHVPAYPILFSLFIVLGAWVIAGIRYCQLEGWSGLIKFFLHLLGCAAVVFLLWLVIFYTFLNVPDSGVGWFVIWFILGAVLFLFWPVGMIFYINRKRGNRNKSTKTEQDEDILDT